MSYKIAIGCLANLEQGDEKAEDSIRAIRDRGSELEPIQIDTIKIRAKIRFTGKIPPNPIDEDDCLID